MTTLANSITQEVTATNVRFLENTLTVVLSDNREISVPLDKIAWLTWLLTATPQQRENWSLEPGGYAVYWEDLDDGIEVSHLLDKRPLTQNNFPSNKK
jgi:hypothetical protein